MSRVAYWQHPMPYVGPVCPIHHRWRWASWLHWRWREFRMWLGVKIAGFESESE